MRESVTPSRSRESQTKSNRREAVRELRQRRAYYRCCIPALAGFVSLRSIVPDGSIQMDQLHHNGNGFLAQSRIAKVNLIDNGQVSPYGRDLLCSGCCGFGFCEPRQAAATEPGAEGGTKCTG